MIGNKQRKGAKRMEDEGSRLTCRDLLSIPSLAGTIVLGGASGLAREISRVNVMEVPDVADWVRPGEFLMTTGYPFRLQPDELAQLIPQLADKGVVALGVKTKRFVPFVPAEAIAAADRVGLALFELPPATAFSDVVRDVMGRVLVRESSSLSTLQNRIQRLANLLLEGKGIDAFLGCLEEMVGNPVLLLDSTGKPFLTAETAELFAADGGPEAALRELRESLAEVPAAESVPVPVGGRRVQAYAAEVPVYRRHSAVLLLLEWRGECGAVDRLTIDQVGALAGLELKNANARRAVEEKYVDQFLQDWLAGRIPTLPDLRLRAGACGVKLEAPAAGERYLAAIVRGAEQGRGKPARLAPGLSHAPLAQGGEAWFTRMGDEYAAILRFRAGMPAEEQRALQQLLAAARAGLSGTAAICAGPAVASPELLQRSYEGAVQVRHICEAGKVTDDIVTVDRLGVYSLLYLLADSADAEAFRERWIGPLAQYDRKHEATSLIDTLEAYFRAKGNVRAAADALFAHYNTVVYRLERIGTMLRVDLEDAEVRLQLQLALKLHRMQASGRGTR